MQREIAAIEHVSREKIRPSRCTAFFRFLNERENKLLEFVLQTVIGVQCNVDRIVRGYAMNMLGDGYRADCRVFDRRAGGERAAARGNLNDAVGLAFSEATQNGVGGRERRDVDGGKSEPSGARPVEHHAVGFVIGDWHDSSSRFVFGKRRRHGIFVSAHFAAVDRVLAQLFLDPQKLIVFRDAVGATERTGLYLSRVRGNGNVCNRRVLGFS